MKKLLAILFVATLVSCGGSTSVETTATEPEGKIDSLVSDSIPVSITEAVTVTEVDSIATE